MVVATHTRACGCEVNYIYSEHLWHAVCLISEGDGVVILAPLTTSKLPHLKFLCWVTTNTHTQGVEERGREGEGGEREGNKKGRKGIGQKSKKHVIKIRQCGHTLTIQISMHACNVWQALWRCVCKPHWAFFPLQVLLSQWLFSEWRHKPAPCCQHWFGEPQSRSSASTIHHQDAKRKKNTKSPIT